MKKYQVELKNIRFYERLSQETNAFTADLYINKKKVGEVRNEGCGGPTDYYANPNAESKQLVSEAENYFKGLPEREYELGSKTIKLPQTLESTIDHIFEEWLKVKGDAKFKKKLEKDMLKGIIYGTNTTYNIVSWKGFDLKGILNHPKGKRTVQEMITKLKSEGHEILNTNLPKDFLS